MWEYLIAAKIISGRFQLHNEICREQIKKVLITVIRVDKDISKRSRCKSYIRSYREFVKDSTDTFVNCSRIFSGRRCTYRGVICLVIND